VILEWLILVGTDFVCIESIGMQVSLRRFLHTIEVLNGLINNNLPWDLGGDLRIEAFYRCNK
jgi:hypothetical protein